LLAGLGGLPDTIADRSIVLRLQRERANQRVARFRYSAVADEAAPIRDALGAWADGFTAPDHPVDVPFELDDRAAEAWEPLLAIADTAGGGGEWPKKARHAALALSAGRDQEEPTTGVKLLADIRQVFDADGAERLLTSELLSRLHQTEMSPWGEEPKLSARRLAKILRGYGVSPTHWRDGRGYDRTAFTDVWERYLVTLSSECASEVSQVSQPSIHAGLSLFSKCHTEGSCDTLKMPENPVSMRVVTHVTDRNAIRRKTEVQTMLSPVETVETVENPAPPRYLWRLPGGQWRDLVAHPPPILKYFDGAYPVEQRDEALADLAALEWTPCILHPV